MMSSARTPSGPADSGPDRKRAALAAVLNSETFSRCDQLKRFLRYVCELEFAGRGHEISEYLVGVEALGRPSTFSPGEDSSVRTRAGALRERLNELYRVEMPDAPLRIEIPKGSYAPRFVEQDPECARQPDRTAVSVNPGKLRSSLKLAAGLVAAAVAGGVLTGWICRSPIPRPADPVIREAWGAFAKPGSEVLICISNPAHFVVQPLSQAPPPARYLPFPNSPELRRTFVGLHPQWPSPSLYLEFSDTSATMGAAMGALTAARTLTELGVRFRAMVTRTVQLPALRGQNVLLFASPEYSVTATRALRRGAFFIDFDYLLGEQTIRERKAVAESPRIYAPKRTNGEVEESFGLITVLPNEGCEYRDYNTVVFAGASSAGIHAASNFFSSIEGLSELRRRLKGPGHKPFPAAYQVVVRCVAQGDLLVSAAYETHRVL